MRIIATPHTEQLTRIAQIERFLNGTAEIDVRGPIVPSDELGLSACRASFATPSAGDANERGLLRRFLSKLTGYSPA